MHLTLWTIPTDYDIYALTTSLFHPYLSITTAPPPCFSDGSTPWPPKLHNHPRGRPELRVRAFYVVEDITERGNREEFRADEGSGTRLHGGEAQG